MASLVGGGAEGATGQQPGAKPPGCFPPRTSALTGPRSPFLGIKMRLGCSFARHSPKWSRHILRLGAMLDPRPCQGRGRWGERTGGFAPGY